MAYKKVGSAWIALWENFGFLANGLVNLHNSAEEKSFKYCSEMVRFVRNVPNNRGKGELCVLQICFFPFFFPTCTLNYVLDELESIYVRNLL